MLESERTAYTKTSKLINEESISLGLRIKTYFFILKKNVRFSNSNLASIKEASTIPLLSISPVISLVYYSLETLNLTTEVKYVTVIPLI